MESVEIERDFEKIRNNLQSIDFYLTPCSAKC